MKGLIALDIDGTTTAEHHKMPEKVSIFLEEIVSSGWRLAMITGRSYTRGMRPLQNLNFPFYYVCQNGAMIIEMPSNKIISKHYIPQHLISFAEQICLEKQTGLVLASGIEDEDRFYYRTESFDKTILKYLIARSRDVDEVWISVNDLSETGVIEYPSIKCFGDKETATYVSNRMERTLPLFVSIIRDPYNSNVFLAQATYEGVNKGGAVKELFKIIGSAGKIIAAGDDSNDCPMLEAADLAIVMSTAPDEIKRKAHVIAPPATECGIIQGIQEALKRISNG